MRHLVSALLCALAMPAHAQTGQRLTLDPVNAVMSSDTTSARLYLTNGANDSAPLSVSLAGLPGAAIYDAFKVGGSLCLVPQPAAPVPTYTLLGGTPIGGMTSNGGLAAAFDYSTLSKPYLVSAHSPGAVTGYTLAGSVGLSLSSPANVTRIVAWTPIDDGWTGSLTLTTWAVFGANTNNFATATQIASGAAPSGSAPSINPPPTAVTPSSIDVSFPNSTAYSYYWFAVSGDGMSGTWLSALQFYSRATPATARNVTNNNGVWTNAIAENCQADTGVIALSALEADYRGSVQIDAAGGAATCQFSAGLDRGCGVWNVTRDAEICLAVNDPRPAAVGPLCHPGIPCYAYIPSQYGATQPPYQFGPAENNPMLRLRVLSGLPIDSVAARLHQNTFANGGSAFWSGIAVNGEPTPCGDWINPNNDTSSPVIAQGHSEQAECDLSPTWGVTTFSIIEGQRYGQTSFWRPGSLALRACVRY